MGARGDLAGTGLGRTGTAPAVMQSVPVNPKIRGGLLEQGCFYGTQYRYLLGRHLV